MIAHERCRECGSWDRECNSPIPVNGCACARCLRDALRKSRNALVEAGLEHHKLFTALKAISSLHPDNAADALLIADAAIGGEGVKT